MLDWCLFETSDSFACRIFASETGIQAIEFHSEIERPARASDSNPFLLQCASQLRAYFAGELQVFDLPLDLQGTGFQKRVWQELLKIPYGETRSYSFVAQAIQAPKAVRAVGSANGRNPIPIVVPCHRVIGAAGSLVGYGGGLPLKKKLLALESRQARFA